MKQTFKYICPKDECTGCMACINACNHSAIKLIKNEIGFDYPVIQSDICISCGLCYRVCPQLNKRELKYPEKCYAAALKDRDLLLKCASGGVATALSDHYIRMGGVVVGCSGKDMSSVQHTIVSNREQLKHLQGSKYIQSFISKDLFCQIRELLKIGKSVLFIGTGCQVAGLQNFLIKKYNNLLTVDLVCHGVPSQQMFNDNMKLYPKIEINSVKFRQKMAKKNNTVTNFGNSIRYGLAAKSQEHIKSFWIPWYKDPYLGAFMDCINFRDGCYKCLYARPERQSDLTICDFWGLHKDSHLYHTPGVSAILVNSEKGNRILAELKPILNLEAREVKEAVRGNGQLQHPSILNSKREIFIRQYLKKGIKKAYLKTSYVQMRKKNVKSILISTVIEYIPCKRLLSEIYKTIRERIRK